ncbi:MAG TPA: Lrp/AsnC family transcriptional regulator [Candidatus Thorarchaeota archaeon]|nr:Lrp/AsnC family transcriptional regulator [Candidatus Thorarchaeota archaeon]
MGFKVGRYRRFSMIDGKSYTSDYFLGRTGGLSMVKAYVLIKMESGKEDEVTREIMKLPVTEEAHTVFGMYDLVAEIRGRDMETLVEFITQKIRRIPGIADTQTLLVVDVELDMSSRLAS